MDKEALTQNTSWTLDRAQSAHIAIIFDACD